MKNIEYYGGYAYLILALYGLAFINFTLNSITYMELSLANQTYLLKTFIGMLIVLIVVCGIFAYGFSKRLKKLIE